MSGSRLPASQQQSEPAARRTSSAPRLQAPRRHASTSGRVTPLPTYDIRVKRELAHRRFALSLVRQGLRIASLHALDSCVVALSAVAAAYLTNTPGGLQAIPAMVAFVLLGLNVQGSYRAGVSRRDSQRLVTGVLIALLVAALPSTLAVGSELSLQFLTLFGLASIASLIVERQVVDAIVHQAYVRGYGLRRALIVSDADSLQSVMSGIARPKDAKKGEPDDQYVVGFVTPHDSRAPGALGNIAQLEDVLDNSDVSELLVATSLADETLSDVAELCFGRGVRVLVIPPAAHTFSGWSELTRVGRWPAYQLHPPRLELPALALKRASDLVLASIGLLCAAPVMLFIGAFIKLESRGPVFFRQLRVGLGGREFLMWKFRSMLLEAEARQTEVAHLNHYGDARLFKLRSDPRITKVGRFLRRFSLDELPQLLNVLSGDMSLVGPRPPLPSEVRAYESRHFVRLSVVPGLTGPWQVNGRNLITDFEEVVRLERDYIESWSLRSDIEIMLRTLGVVISGKGAY